MDQNTSIHPSKMPTSHEMADDHITSSETAFPTALQVQAVDPVFLTNDPSFVTRSIYEGFEADQWESKAVVPPITLATGFKQEFPDERGEFFYSRYENPSRRCLERTLATLDDAKYAMAFGSGTAAYAAVLQLLQAGDHLIASQDIYSGTAIYCSTICRRQGIDVEFVDCRDISLIAKALKPSTRMLFLETPTNPSLVMVDFEKVTALIRQHNLDQENNRKSPQLSTELSKTEISDKYEESLKKSKVSDQLLISTPLDKKTKKVLTALDNTFLSPYFQRALNFGIDIVLQSCSKYLNGSADVIMGVVCTNCDVLNEKLKYLQVSAGGVPSTLDCYLLQRSLRTLALRMEKHMSNGLAVARYLENHPFVRKVNHPGLPSHPQHQLALRQTHGHSGMLSFYLKEDDMAKTRRFTQALKLITLSTSLGGVKSAIEIPLVMSGSGYPASVNQQKGVSEGLVQLSVGVENPAHLLQDLGQALDAVFKCTE